MIGLVYAISALAAMSFFVWGICSVMMNGGVGSSLAPCFIATTVFVVIAIVSTLGMS